MAGTAPATHDARALHQHIQWTVNAPRVDARTTLTLRLQRKRRGDAVGGAGMAAPPLMASDDNPAEARDRHNPNRPSTGRPACHLARRSSCE